MAETTRLPSLNTLPNTPISVINSAWNRCRTSRRCGAAGTIGSRPISKTLLRQQRKTILIKAQNTGVTVPRELDRQSRRYDTEDTESDPDDRTVLE